MFVHGGISDDDEILGDSYIYTIPTQKWSVCHINTDSPFPTLCHHTIELILPAEQKYNQKLTIYKLTETRVARRGEKNVK